jgi:natural product precursor
MKKTKKNLNLVNLAKSEIKKQEMDQLLGGTDCSATCQCTMVGSSQTGGSIMTYISHYYGN